MFNKTIGFFLAFLVSGCSFTMRSPVGTPQQKTDIHCTANYEKPGIDIGIATGFVVVGTIAAIDLANNPNDRTNVGIDVPFIVGSSILTAGFLTSSMIGAHKASKCIDLKEAQEQFRADSAQK
jgi:hypothetical protein